MSYRMDPRLDPDLVERHRRLAEGISLRKVGTARLRALAIFGTVVAFAAGLIPGFIALRGYLKWQRGDKARPALAYFFAAGSVALFVISLVSSFLGYPADQLSAVPFALVWAPAAVAGLVGAFGWPNWLALNRRGSRVVPLPSEAGAVAMPAPPVPAPEGGVPAQSSRSEESRAGVTASVAREEASYKSGARVAIAAAIACVLVASTDRSLRTGY